MNSSKKVFFVAMWSDAVQHWINQVRWLLVDGWLTFVLDAKFYNFTSQDDNLFCCEMVEFAVLRPGENVLIIKDTLVYLEITRHREQKEALIVLQWS